MASRVAPWAFAAVYGIVAIIAIWGGVAALAPPAPPPSQFDPNPLPPLVNSGMFTAAMFYFVTALAFAAATAHAVLLVRRQEPLALQLGLNTAFAALLAVIAAYNIWYGGILLSLGGDFYFLFIGLALAVGGLFGFAPGRVICNLPGHQFLDSLAVEAGMSSLASLSA